MPLNRFLKRSASFSEPSTVPSDSEVDVSPTEPAFNSLSSRKGSLPSDMAPIVKSEGVEFAMLENIPAAASPALSSSRLFGNIVSGKLHRAKKRQIPASEPKSRILLPAFNHRSRSESCSASLEPAQLPSIAETPRPTRPKMVRKASSAGDLGSLLNSLEIPLTPESNGKFARQQRIAHTSAAPDTPPETPIPRQRLESLSSRTSVRSRGRSSSGTSERKTVDSTPLLRDKKLLRPSRDKSTLSQVQQVEETRAQLVVNGQIINLDLAGDGTLVLKSNHALDFDWKAVGKNEYEIRLRKQDYGRTPVPPSDACFSSTPMLSPSINSPDSPFLQTPEPPSSAFQPKPIIKSDLFWTGSPLPPTRVQRPVSPFSVNSSDSEAPLTPKRCGFVLPDEFSIAVDGPPISRFDTLASKSQIVKSSTPRKSKQRHSLKQLVAPVMHQNNENEWHGYDGFLGIFHAESKPFQPALPSSNLAQRRLGSRAETLKLGLSPPSSSLPAQSIVDKTLGNSDKECSHWSETEGSDSLDDSSSLFSNDSR